MVLKIAERISRPNSAGAVGFVIESDSIATERGEKNRERHPPPCSPTSRLPLEAESRRRRKRGGFARARSPACSLCRQATWLILPVVICLSQRLSHACLRASSSRAKLRMAH